MTRRPVLLAPLVALALLLAGCVGAAVDGPVEPAADDDAHAESEGSAPGDAGDAPPSEGPPSEDPPSEPDQGDPDAEAPDADTDAASPDAADPAAPVATLAFDGTLGTGFWACQSADSGTTCQGTGATGGDTSYEPEFDAAVLTYHIELAWDAATPLTESLRLSFALCSATACEHLVAEGPSPLTLQGTVVGDLGNPRLDVGPVATPLAEGVSVFVEHEQPFTITGTLVGKVRQPGSAGFAGHDGDDAGPGQD